MTSAPVREPLADHLLTPESAAFLPSTSSRHSSPRSARWIMASHEARRLVGQDHQTFRVPVVHSTVNVASGQGSTLPELAGLLAEDKPLDRTTVNSWEDIGPVQAVHAPAAASSSSAPCGPKSAWPSPHSMRCAKDTRSTPSSTRSAAPRPSPTARAWTA